MQKSALFKWIGIAAMTIDHIGVIFFPQIIIFRAIGRLALPMFIGALIEGEKHTSNIKQYFSRLLIFALISQIPFQLFLGQFKLNIIFSLVLCLAALVLVKKRKYLLTVMVILISAFLPVEYAWYAPVTAVIIVLLEKRKNYAIGLIFLATIIYTVQIFYVAQVVFLVQLLAIIGYIIVIYPPKIEFKLAINKYFFYFYYPAHLLILYVLARMIG